MAQQHLQLEDVQLAYREWGTGEPVLLLHGLADHGLVWESLGQFLATGAGEAGDRHSLQTFHTVAPDLRGHGNSSKPATGYHSDDVIQDLNGLMDALGWESAHVIGHSWMGKVACLWATRQPERFRRLVLIDPFFINAMPGWINLTFPILYRVLPFLKGMGPFPSYEAAEANARTLKQYRGWSPLQQAVFQEGTEKKPDGTWGSKFVAPARDEVFDDVMRIAGLTQPITIPTMLVLPEKGLNRTAWQINPYRKFLQNLTIQKVPGNHWAFLVEPEAFNRAIAHFLNS
jgi:pimeloyl-ACP methyl ester carboxylesterase